LTGDVEQALRDLLRSADKGIVERTAADILKALLLLYGSAWEGDLMDTLAGLWSVRGMGLEELGEAEAAIPEAEKLLVEKGLIRVEKRYRADLGEGGPILEKFISTDHLLLLMKVFSGDVELDKFRYQMMQG
jgi:hypothetical protein